ncbi:MAG: hypothetical protein ACXVCX_21515, partial [Ktedonobacterales bacterium]
MTIDPGHLESVSAVPTMHGAVTLTIVDTTLREGEQFIAAHFTTEERLTLARQLDAFGVDVIELPSPRISPRTAADVERIVALDLRARVVAHVRCVAEDAFRTVLADLLPVFDAVVEAGVQRIGLPDTVGVATPWQVAERI